MLFSGVVLCLSLLSFTTLALGVAAKAISSQWQHETSLGVCEHLFRPSQRESARNSQVDPLVLWLGRPSMSIHVEGKYGPIPMPSVWVSFVNVLYITKCPVDQENENHSTGGGTYSSLLTEFLSKWLELNSKYQQRDIYLAGDEDDVTGGSYLLTVAMKWKQTASFSLKGLLLGNPSHVAMISRHYGHRSFETLNNMTSWSMNRARQTITCNSHFSQVDFVMNDIQLHYTPVASSSSSAPDGVEGMHEYELSTVSSYGRCYSSPEEWEADWLSTSATSPSPHLYESIYPTLTHTGDTDPVYPPCSPHLTSPQQSVQDQLTTLLSDPAFTVVMYSSLYKSSEAICSFYIGIYTADGVQYRPPPSSSSPADELFSQRIKEFNEATLLPYESAWTIASSSSKGRRESEPKGVIQDGIDSSGTGSGGGGGLVWIQFDHRYAPILAKQERNKNKKRSRDYEELLHRVTAVDLLAHLLGKHRDQDAASPSSPHLILDYTDLFL
jgi:hypothetical protein